MNDIQGYQNGPIETGASRAKEMSPRAYNLAMSAPVSYTHLTLPTNSLV